MIPGLLCADAIPAAVQPAGEAALAEMVHAASRAGEEEGDPGHDDPGAGPPAAFLQLSPVEGSEDRLQEVGWWISPERESLRRFVLRAVQQ